MGRGFNFIYGRFSCKIFGTFNMVPYTNTAGWQWYVVQWDNFDHLACDQEITAAVLRSNASLLDPCQPTMEPV